MWAAARATDGRAGAPADREVLRGARARRIHTFGGNGHGDLLGDVGVFDQCSFAKTPDLEGAVYNGTADMTDDSAVVLIIWSSDALVGRLRLARRVLQQITRVPP